MQIQIQAQIEELQRMTVRELRGRYREIFGEESRSNHKQFLFRRIAWRLQADAEGGLSERARRRALEIANDADLRIRAPKEFDFDAAGQRCVQDKIPPDADPRRPLPGTVLEREYKGQTIIVKVREDGFDYLPLAAVECAVSSGTPAYLCYGSGRHPTETSGEGDSGDR